MNLFQEFFVTAMIALIVSCIIVKLVSGAVLRDGRVDKEKIVVEESKITKGLVVRSRKSKKRVKFVEQEIVGSVDRVEIKKPNKVGVEEEMFVEKKIVGILKKGDDFKGDFENLDLIEHCGGERQVSDGHDDVDMCSEIGLMEEKDDEVKMIEEKTEDVLRKGDDFKGKMVFENLDLIEHCGGEREVSHGQDDADMSSEIGLLEEKDEVKKIEGENEDILRKGDDFKGEKVSENLDLIDQCGGEREVSDVHEDADMCRKIGLLEEIEVKKLDCILKKGHDFQGEKVSENLDLIEHCGGEREVSDGHEDSAMSSKIGLLEEKDEVKIIDELLVVKEKDIVNPMIVDEVKLGENEVVEVGGGLSKGDDEKTNKMVMYEDSDDDWEGIERSELEEEFFKAVNFVDGGNGKNSGMENLGSELMMQLYGLQKITMEGPCHEPQPMALKVYARAKWNAWQKMGSMNPEVAMEQYIKLLSDHVPEWTHHSKDDCEVGSSETKMTGEIDSFPDSLNYINKNERTQDINRAAEGDNFSGGEKDKE